MAPSTALTEPAGWVHAAMQDPDNIDSNVLQAIEDQMLSGLEALDFLNQVKFWGVTPSFAFVAEPQTNGVAERFNRTLKEQAIHGRVFRNLEEVRAAVIEFKDRYNRYWRLEKLGFLSPHEARQAATMKEAA
jgi:hypothetical protein